MPAGVKELNFTADTNKDQLNKSTENEAQSKEKAIHVEGRVNHGLGYLLEVNL